MSGIYVTAPSVGYELLAEEAKKIGIFVVDVVIVGKDVTYRVIIRPTDTNVEIKDIKVRFNPELSTISLQYYGTFTVHDTGLSGAFYEGAAAKFTRLMNFAMPVQITFGDGLDLFQEAYMKWWDTRLAEHIAVGGVTKEEYAANCEAYKEWAASYRKQKDAVHVLHSLLDLIAPPQFDLRSPPSDPGAVLEDYKRRRYMRAASSSSSSPSVADQRALHIAHFKERVAMGTFVLDMRVGSDIARVRVHVSLCGRVSLTKEPITLTGTFPVCSAIKDLLFYDTYKKGSDYEGASKKFRRLVEICEYSHFDWSSDLKVFSDAHRDWFIEKSAAVTSPSPSPSIDAQRAEYNAQLAERIAMGTFVLNMRVGSDIATVYVRISLDGNISLTKDLPMTFGTAVYFAFKDLFVYDTYKKGSDYEGASKKFRRLLEISEPSDFYWSSELEVFKNAYRDWFIEKSDIATSSSSSSTSSSIVYGDLDSAIVQERPQYIDVEIAAHREVFRRAWRFYEEPLFHSLYPIIQRSHAVAPDADDGKKPPASPPKPQSKDAPSAPPPKRHCVELFGEKKDSFFEGFKMVRASIVVNNTSVEHGVLFVAPGKHMFFKENDQYVFSSSKSRYGHEITASGTKYHIYSDSKEEAQTIRDQIVAYGGSVPLFS
jgi:hypothetical protein